MIIISHFFLEHLNNIVEATLSCTLLVAWNYCVYYQTTQTGFNIYLDLFLIWQLPFFKNFYKDLHLRCCKRPSSDSHYRHFCFAQLDLHQFEANFYRWILISLRPIFTLYRNRSINSNGKEDGWLLWDGNILISNSLRKQMCTW